MSAERNLALRRKISQLERYWIKLFDKRRFRVFQFGSDALHQFVFGKRLFPVQ